MCQVAYRLMTVDMDADHLSTVDDLLHAPLFAVGAG